MSTTVHNAPTLSDEALVQLGTQTKELEDKAAALKEELERTNVLIKISKLVSEVKHGTPINIVQTREYHGKAISITNVTPTPDQYKEERSASYSDNGKGTVPLRLNLGSGGNQMATTSIVCPSVEVAHAVGMEFVATGKFPFLNKLLCQFKKEAEKVVEQPNG